MVINRETDYAIRLLRGLQDGRLVQTAVLAEEEQIPQPFAYKIIKKLSKNGLVVIKQGASGGVKLSCSLSETSLYDLLCAVDQMMLLNDCMKSGYSCEWEQEHGGCGSCHVHKELCRHQKNINEELKAIFLSELIGSDCAKSRTNQSE